MQLKTSRAAVHSMHMSRHYRALRASLRVHCPEKLCRPRSPWIYAAYTYTGTVHAHAMLRVHVTMARACQLIDKRENQKIPALIMSSRGMRTVGTSALFRACGPRPPLRGVLKDRPGVRVPSGVVVHPDFELLERDLVVSVTVPFLQHLFRIHLVFALQILQSDTCHCRFPFSVHTYAL